MTGILAPANGGSGVANSKNLTWGASLTLNGTDATTMTFPGTSATIARTDAGQTFTGTQNFPQIITSNVTAKSWDAGFASVIQLTNGGLVSNGTTVRLPQNAYYNGGFKYMTTAASSSYESIGTAHDFYLAASGTADNAITYVNVLDISVKGLTVATGALGANQFRATQGTVPTVTTNGGTSPSCVGSDTGMICTIGTSPPAAATFTVTFNGTWAAAPSCVAMRGTAGASPLVQNTVTATGTVQVNLSANLVASEKYHIHCIGVS